MQSRTGTTAQTSLAVAIATSSVKSVEAGSWPEVPAATAPVMSAVPS
ncbi:hypothetical protein OH768_11670 [Streptomyces sp. NBC_01622]|nr:hypothetical protein OH768_11670 [Streptomyces sp. NBC_01622]